MVELVDKLDEPDLFSHVGIARLLDELVNKFL